MSTKIKTVEAGCPKCSGTGFHGEHPVPAQNPFCPDCSGRGKTAAPETDTQKCPECNGRGHVEHVPCPGCCHTGRLVTQGGDGSPSRPSDEGGHDVQAALITGLQADAAIHRAKIESLTTENGQLIAEIGDLKKNIKGLSKQLKDAEKAAPKERGPARASDILAGVAGTSTDSAVSTQQTTTDASAPKAQ